MSLRVALVGAESAAVKALDALAGGGHEVVAVLVEQPDTIGAGLERRAGQLAVPTLPVERVAEPAFGRWIEEWQVDVLLNVHSLTIVDAAVADAPRIGSFNLHPGPLPEYAGLNTVTWAIARGEPEHGVTLHWIDAGVDTGRIAYDERFPIGDDDTALTVFSTCIRLGLQLVDLLLATAELDPGAIPARRQVGPRTVYRRGDVPQDGRVEWARPARRVHDLARASNFGPFPSPCGHPQAMLGSVPVGIVGTNLTHRRCTAVPGTIDRTDHGETLVATADQWLAVTNVSIEGRRVSASDVLEPGQVLADGPSP